MTQPLRALILPPTLPIFPLNGALLLPCAQLPLNIFEPRYLEMVDDALKEHRMIGMIQTKGEGAEAPLYEIGCAGRIFAFEETDDGRYLIHLQGISRFRIQEELDTITRYRRAQVDWSEFTHDREETDCFGYKKEEFFSVLKTYFSRHDIDLNWELLMEAPDEKIISALSMICPFDPREKQALLEAKDCKTRGELLLAMLEIGIYHQGKIN